MYYFMLSCCGHPEKPVSKTTEVNFGSSFRLGSSKDGVDILIPQLSETLPAELERAVEPSVLIKQRGDLILWIWACSFFQQQVLWLLCLSSTIILPRANFPQNRPWFCSSRLAKYTQQEFKDPNTVIIQDDCTFIPSSAFWKVQLKV